MDHSSPKRGFNTEIYRIQNKSPLKLLERFRQGNSPLSKNEKPQSPIKDAAKTNSPMSIQNSSLSIKDFSMSTDDDEDLELSQEYCLSYNDGYGYDHFGDVFDVEDFINVDIDGYLNVNDDTPPVSPLQENPFAVLELDYSVEDFLHDLMSDDELCEDDGDYEMPPIEDVPLPELM